MKLKFYILVIVALAANAVGAVVSAYSSGFWAPTIVLGILACVDTLLLWGAFDLGAAGSAELKRKVEDSYLSIEMLRGEAKQIKVYNAKLREALKLIYKSMSYKN